MREPGKTPIPPGGSIGLGESSAAPGFLTAPSTSGGATDSARSAGSTGHKRTAEQRGRPSLISSRWSARHRRVASRWEAAHHELNPSRIPSVQAELGLLLVLPTFPAGLHCFLRLIPTNAWARECPSQFSEFARKAAK